MELSLLQLNKLYEHGKNGPDTFDCAGLVWFVYNEICNLNLYSGGFGLSTTTKIMTCSCGSITLYDETDLQKDLTIVRGGDILFFHRQSMNDSEPRKDNKYPGHCGIYLGNNNFIHCSRPKGKVIVSNFLKNAYWQEVLVASKDVFTSDLVYQKVKK